MHHNPVQNTLDKELPLSAAKTTSRILIPTPAGFNFWRTVFSHGWCALPPFSVDKESGAMARVLELHDGAVVHCVATEDPRGVLLSVESEKRLTVGQKKDVSTQMSDCLRLNEDLSDFYAEARRRPATRWIPRYGAGRLLRSPTVFEDVVKMICTTNCSWSLTEVMVGNFTSHLGKKFADGLSTFPTPAAIAGTTDAFLRRHIRAGYRSPYLLEFATRVANGDVDPQRWRSSSLATQDLYEEVRSVKGMGEYAAGNILKLLGRYEYLGLDSWVRGKYYELHTRGRKVTDSTIERRYEMFGSWKGLFFWLEMTRDWYLQKFPF